MLNKNDWYDELMAKSDIVQIISEYVPLNKKGASYWGCCPFHYEKTASFSVSQAKQVYYCFGCHESGNVVTFIKKMENVEYGDAIKILARKAGVELPVNEFHKKDNREIIKKKERLCQLMRESARFYNNNLFNSPAANDARNYLKNRGINGGIAKRFGLGYSTGGSEIIAHLTSLGYTPQEMKEAGITAVSEKGAYDVFYGRLMFPIISNLDEVIAFGGRTLKQNPDFAKYRNSAQTLIFDKSKVIYGINLLKKKKQKEKINHIILCEGYMDVIALHMAGFDCAVASMGTALTFNQAKQLKNYVDRVYISYDGDTAGQKASLKGLDILASVGLNVRVVNLPDGLDPDDVIRKKGKEFYQKLLDEAITLTVFKINALKKQYDVSDLDERAKFAVEAVNIIKNLENPVEQEQYVAMVQDITGYSKQALYRQASVNSLNAVKSRENTYVAQTPKNGEKTVAISKASSAEKFILASIAAEKDYVDFTEDFTEIFSSEFLREVAAFFVNKRIQQKTSVAEIYEQFDDCFASELADIINYKFIDGDNGKKYKECVFAIKLARLIGLKDALTEKYMNFSQDKQILEDIREIDKKLTQLRSGELDEE